MKEKEKTDDIEDIMSEEVINLNKTRKAFIPEYLCSIFFLLLYISFLFNNITFPSIAKKIILTIGVLVLLFAEGSRKMVSYQITPEKLIITHGIIKQAKKNVHFNPLGFVPDINVRQGLLQRILDYGDVFIEGAGQNQLEIKDVNQPHQIMKIIEERIELNRTLSSKRRV